MSARTDEKPAPDQTTETGELGDAELEAVAGGTAGELQFQIQVGTSDLQNAENVRSQAEKRLEQQRKDLTRNWGG